jgi:hypothetical protein
MPVLKLILAILVSVGLVLAPVAVANTMASASAGLMDDAGQATSPSTDKACPCCDKTGKCVVAVCSMGCSLIGVASDVSFPIVLVGHAALSGIVPPMHNGLGWRPPTPPPRV